MHFRKTQALLYEPGLLFVLQPVAVENQKDTIILNKCILTIQYNMKNMWLATLID